VHEKNLLFASKRKCTGGNYYCLYISYYRAYHPIYDVCLENQINPVYLFYTGLLAGFFYISLQYRQDKNIGSPIEAFRLI